MEKKRNTILTGSSEQQQQITREQGASMLNAAVNKMLKLLKQNKLPIETAMKGKQISFWRKVAGAAQIEVIIGTMLLGVAAAFNTPRNLSEEQAVDTANYIQREYWFLKLAEIALFCDKAKSGCYGEAYGGIDRPTIIKWLDAYCESRELLIIQQQIKAQEKFKYLSPRISDNQQIDEAYQSFKANYEREKILKANGNTEQA